jgi:hypothetical protein
MNKRKVPRKPDPRISDPTTHRQRWVNLTVAAIFLDGMDRRGLLAYIDEGLIRAEWKGRRRRIHIDELVRFQGWLRQRAAAS